MMTSTFTRSVFSFSRLVASRNSNLCTRPLRFYCTPPPPPPPQKESMFQRLKQMGKDYWYVVIPVHTTTSIIWAGIFYEAAKSGVDLKSILQWFGVRDSITDKIVNTGAGNLAVTYALYKLATPVRYTVTCGCSMYAINYLKKRGYVTAKELSKQARDKAQKHRDKFIKSGSGSSKPPSTSDKPH